MRKSKETTKCPELLEEIIELTNLLPTNAETLFDEICEERIISRNDKGLIISDTAKEILDEKLVDYIFDREPKTEFLERFNDLTKAKNLFRHFAELNKNFPDWTKNKIDKHQQYKFLLHFLTVNYQSRKFPVLLGFTNEGFIKPSKSEFLEIFETNNIPFYRIKACGKCSKIFWANRTDAKVCKKQCSEILSTSNYTNKNKEEINAKRRENYYYKKGYKAGKDFCENCIYLFEKCNCNLKECK